jgi:hypothetical protein
MRKGVREARCCICATGERSDDRRNSQPMTRLEQIQARLSRLALPWYICSGTLPGTTRVSTPRSPNGNYPVDERPENADFIIHAPTDLADTLPVVRAAIALMARNVEGYEAIIDTEEWSALEEAVDVFQRGE